MERPKYLYSVTYDSFKQGFILINIIPLNTAEELKMQFMMDIVL